MLVMAAQTRMLKELKYAVVAVAAETLIHLDQQVAHGNRQ
jgi:hypothetical protein